MDAYATVLANLSHVVAHLADIGDFHLERRLRKAFEEPLEQGGDFGPRFRDRAVLVDEFTLLHEERCHAARIGGVEGLDGGFHLTANHRLELG